MTNHGIDVVYRLDRIALEIASKMHEQGLLHVSGSADGDDGLSMNGPSALVMVQGKMAKQAHNAVNEAGEYVVGGISTNGKVAVILGIVIVLVISYVNSMKKQEAK